MDGFDALLQTLTEQVNVIRESFSWTRAGIQTALIAASALLGWSIAVFVRKHVNFLPYTRNWPAAVRRPLRAAIANLGIILCIGFLMAIRPLVHAVMLPNRSSLIGAAISLATAWIVIALLTSLIRNAFVKRVVSIIAWAIAALSILGLLDDVITALDRTGIAIGGLRVTALLALKTAALMMASLWAAILLSNIIDRRLRTYSDLTPSIQVLLGKLFRVAVITIAVLTVLGSVGIDFSALAIFSGAVGVGIGFGLQKIVSNLVSGIILLADKSIKPGDVITVGDRFGWVDTMGARYTSVAGRDGREFLIPNDDFITQRVINWSYSDSSVRLDIKFNVTNNCDPHMVRRIALEAARASPRVLVHPEPTCHLHAFGDKSFNFVLRFFIRDPRQGLGSVRNDVLFALWDAFKRQGIEFP